METLGTDFTDAPNPDMDYEASLVSIALSRYRPFREENDDLAVRMKDEMSLVFEIQIKDDRPIADVREVTIRTALDDTNRSLIRETTRLTSSFKQQYGRRLSGCLDPERSTPLEPLIPRTEGQLHPPTGDYELSPFQVQITLHLTNPARNAKTLRLLEGSAVFDVGMPEDCVYELDSLEIGKPMDLDASGTLSMRMREIGENRITVRLTGELSRFGMVSLFDAAGRELNDAYDVSKVKSTAEATDLYFERETLLDKSDLGKPATIHVAIYKEVEPLEVPFKFEDIKLP